MITGKGDIPKSLAPLFETPLQISLICTEIGQALVMLPALPFLYPTVLVTNILALFGGFQASILISIPVPGRVLIGAAPTSQSQALIPFSTQLLPGTMEGSDGGVDSPTLVIGNGLPFLHLGEGAQS